MVIYCLEDFKVEFEKLISKNSYKSLQKEIISYFFDKTIKDLSSETRLNGHSENPYIKKRLKGSGGFRCYFLLILKNEDLYLMFVHPKTGSMGSSNITDESKTYLYKKVLDCIKSDDLYVLSLDDSKKKIIFNKKSE
ncbi:hypothetical protein [Polaribacter sp. Hel_I_88]|uniref:hypothetical protein n=1 Tax=Polaribacter sp. Hel_I_88 TaxID=1250006 RepID=UPI00047EAF75|nr:hypothetical protein [Polaribacter sp. Hel_I_88]